MARSVAQAFALFLQRLTPSSTERNAAASHRKAVKDALERRLDVLRMFETGSFTHGTGISGHADVDLLVSLGGLKPQVSDTALRTVRSALSARFVLTPVKVRSPAVVIEFGKGQQWEVIPGHVKSTTGTHTYWIPQPGGNWIASAPEAHVAYVNAANSDSNGGAKKLARLAKAWKHYNGVPISSFYLEMRAAQYAAANKPFVAVYDVAALFRSLVSQQLAALNDPSGKAGRIHACSSDALRSTALSKLGTAETRARKALDAHQNGKPATAFEHLDRLFGYRFPSR